MMSFCCCLTNSKGFVMASDSRSSVNGVPVSDAFRKVVYIPEAGLGVIGAGQNVFGGVEFADVVLAQKELLVLSGPEDALTHLEQTMEQLGVKEGVNLCAAQARKGRAPALRYLDFGGTAAGGIKSADFWRNVPFSYGHLGETLLSQVFAPYPSLGVAPKNWLCVDYSTFELEELARFAAFLVSLHRNVSKYHTQYPNTVGGPTQLLAVDREGRVAEAQNITIA